MNIKRSLNGYRQYYFKDFNGNQCYIKESSETREDCVILGKSMNIIQLTKEEAKNIIKLLNQFVESGKFHLED